MRNKIKNTYLYIKLQCLYTKLKYGFANRNRTLTEELEFTKFEAGINLLYIGTDELQDKSGFLQELEKFCQLTLFTKFDGSYGQYSEKRYNKKSGRVLNTERLTHLLTELDKKGEIPEVILTQSWARLWDIDNLKLLKKQYGFKFINICMDDRHSFYMFSFFRKYNRGTSGFMTLLDGSLVTSKESTNWYLSKNVPSLYFPEATSSLFFNKLDVPKKFDVGFVGAKYGLRGEYVQYLIDNGIGVEAYGNGWDNGRIDNSNVNKFMNECKIVIGFGYILGCHDFMALKLRDFDVPATGTFYLTTENDDLYDLYPEKESCYFSSKESLLEKTLYFLNNGNEREAIALASYRNTIDNHTYDKRFAGLFK